MLNQCDNSCSGPLQVVFFIPYRFKRTAALSFEHFGFIARSGPQVRLHLVGQSSPCHFEVIIYVLVLMLDAPQL